MSFDRLARHYRWMEATLAGGLLQRCRTRWLPHVVSSHRVLLAGEGHGRMLEACARALPNASFTVIDQSPGMIREARRRWGQGQGRQPVDFQVADLREWRNSAEPFDLVITNFFLDCFAPDELTRVVANLSAATSPHARWLISDFTVPPEGWRRFRARAVLALAYGFFRIATDISARRITPPDDLLRQNGFVLQQREQYNHALLHSDLWAKVP